MGDSFLLIEEKVRIMGLLNLIFNLPKDSLIIPFSDISRATGLPVENVELVLMKSLAKGLIKGKIDQIGQKMNVTWLMARVLDNERLGVMKTKIEDFEGRSNELLKQVELISNASN